MGADSSGVDHPAQGDETTSQIHRRDGEPRSPVRRLNGMPFLVDGDNLLGTWPGRDRSSEERRTLSRTIIHTSRQLRRRIVVVFDGPVPGTLPPSTDIRFSGNRKLQSQDHSLFDGRQCVVQTQIKKLKIKRCGRINSWGLRCNEKCIIAESNKIFSEKLV